VAFAVEGFAMPNVFEETSLGGMTLRNRFVRSATWEAMAADDGSCTPELVEVMADLARGEIGLIISSHAYVSPEGQAGPRQIAVYDDRFVVGLRKMVNAAHEYGAKMILQLAHAGIRALTPLTKREPVGPSPLPRAESERGRAMEAEEIEGTIEAFAAAARRAKEAGCDGVQIHAAHGYLLSQFLSPHFNKRSDDYGGGLRERARIVMEALRRIREVAGDSYPVLIKMNSEDFLDDGLTVAEMLQVAAMLEGAGIDGIELSGGVNDPACHQSPVREGTPLTEDEEAYYWQAARRYKERIGVPLILVGGIRSYTVSQQLIEDGYADYIALSRPLIREPNLIARWKYGDIAKSECGSCNACFGPIRRGDGFYCEQRRSD
jgi:2,4-dienoyl-CoA reductase-like NADH-dependent reductase (Old Yellow Enzyme family)